MKPFVERHQGEMSGLFLLVLIGWAWRWLQRGILRRKPRRMANGTIQIQEAHPEPQTVGSPAREPTSCPPVKVQVASQNLQAQEQPWSLPNPHAAAIAAIRLAYENTDATAARDALSPGTRWYSLTDYYPRIWPCSPDAAVSPCAARSCCWSKPFLALDPLTGIGTGYGSNSPASIPSRPKSRHHSARKDPCGGPWHRPDPDHTGHIPPTFAQRDVKGGRRLGMATKS